jgi:hypothetical protein
VFVPVLEAGLGDEPYHGRQGLRRWVSEVDESWERFEAKVEEVEERETVLLVRLHVFLRARQSGIALEQTVWHVARVNSIGLFDSVRAFVDEAEARRAAGKR